MRSHFIIGFLLITLVILLITKLELATKNFSSQLDSFTIVYKADHILAPETPHLVLRSKAKQTRNKEDVIHVVMTTFKNDPNDHGIRAQIERNTEHSWANLHPRVKLMTGCARKAVDGDGDVDCERNHAGTPTLRGFYRLAFERYPNAATFTFFNGDIISDMSFVDTADAVVKAVRQGKLRERFFVVGRRTNVDWSKVSVQDVADPRFNFRQTIVDGGKVFWDNAQDYFMVSRSTLKFEDEIPPFVIGRAGYDNWLVNYAKLHHYIDTVDATQTLVAMHQTDDEGVTARGGKNIDDPGFNYFLSENTGFTFGRTTLCDYFVQVKGYDAYKSAARSEKARFDFHNRRRNKQPFSVSLRFDDRFGSPFTVYGKESRAERTKRATQEHQWVRTKENGSNRNANRPGHDSKNNNNNAESPNDERNSNEAVEEEERTPLAKAGGRTRTEEEQQALSQQRVAAEKVVHKAATAMEKGRSTTSINADHHDEHDALEAMIDDIVAGGL